MGEVGYKNPPQNRQFGQPGGNPQGATSAQRKAEIANAEKATLICGRLLDAIVEATAGGASMDLIEAGILKLLKDAEDRGLGTAVQSVNLESPAGSMSPAKIVNVIVYPDKKPQ